jgi:hypothetical protein
MRNRTSTRYCADPEALEAMRRDGIGWGHDLDSGCFRDTQRTTKPNPIARLFRAAQRKA